MIILFLITGIFLIGWGAYCLHGAFRNGGRQLFFIKNDDRYVPKFLMAKYSTKVITVIFAIIVIMSGFSLVLHFFNSL